MQLLEESLDFGSVCLLILLLALLNGLYYLLSAIVSICLFIVCLFDHYFFISLYFIAHIEY